MSIRAGIERYDPELLQRKAEIVAWNGAHPDHTVSPTTTVAVHATPTATAATPASGWLGTVIRYALLLALVAAVVRWPRTAWRVVRAIFLLLQMAVDRLLIRRAAKRRRRRAVALRAVTAHTQRFARPHHIYDELF